MEFHETLATAFGSLRSHKMRSALTVLGIVIGAGALLAVMSLISGLNQSVAAQFQSLGSDIISVSRYPWVQTGPGDEFENRRRLTTEDSRAVERLDAVSLVAPNIHTRRNVSYEGQSLSRTLITGSTPEYETIDNYAVEVGRFLTDFDVERHRAVAAIGFDVAEHLFGLTDPMGKTIRIGGDRFRVVGVLKEKGDILGESLDDLVIIPITAFEKSFGRRRSVVIDCQPGEGVVIDRAIEDIRQLLRIRRHVARGEPDDFAINTQDQLLSTYQRLTGVLYLVMVGIVLLALLVGGIGIMNVMLVSVAERTREIGVRKAIGAKTRDIKAQFLVESIMLTMIGGGIGIGGGLSLGLLVRAVTPLPAAVTAGSIFIGAAFSLVTGLVFGVYPAARASRLDPIEALRYE